MFKRLLQSSKGRSSSKTAMKIGVTTAQACDFIADSIIRQISHYVPAIAMKHVPMVFSACEPLLYNHLLPTRFLVKQMDNERGTIETPASLLCELLGLSIDKIADDVTLKDYGLDSIGGLLITFNQKLCFSCNFFFKQSVTARNWLVTSASRLDSWSSWGPWPLDSLMTWSPLVRKLETPLWKLTTMLTPNTYQLPKRTWWNGLHMVKWLQRTYPVCNRAFGFLMFVLSPLFWILVLIMRWL